MGVGTVALRELGFDVSCMISELDDNRFFKWVASRLAVGRSYQSEKSKAAQET
jgi:hypothetical protein